MAGSQLTGQLARAGRCSRAATARASVLSLWGGRSAPLHGYSCIERGGAAPSGHRRRRWASRGRVGRPRARFEERVDPSFLPSARGFAAAVPPSTDCSSPPPPRIRRHPVCNLPEPFPVKVARLSSSPSLSLCLFQNYMYYACDYSRYGIWRKREMNTER